LFESANAEKPRSFGAVTISMIIEVILVLWLLINATIEGAYGWYLEYVALLILEVASVAGVLLLRKWGAVAALVAQGIFLEHILYMIDDLIFYPENFGGNTDIITYSLLAALSIIIATIIIVYLFKWLAANKLK
jgi:hypothetical protein